MSESPQLPFANVTARTSVDNMLRTTQQIHAQLSAMADQKANIMITASSIVITISLSRIGDEDLRNGLLTLCVFMLASLCLAILAVLPKTSSPKTVDGMIDIKSPMFNILFFGHFARLPVDEYVREMSDIAADDAKLYETVVRDIYGIGYVLHTKKYKFIRWSYICFLGGLAVAALETAIFVFLQST